MGYDIISVSRGGNTSGVGKPTLGVELLAEAVYDPTFRHATFLKEILRNPLTNSPTCAIIQVQGARKTKVACECVGAEVKWHGEESNPFCPILGADKGSSSPNQAKRK